jgi:cytochrome c551/c552
MFRVLIFGALATLLVGTTAAAETLSAQRVLLNQYCVTCHNQKLKTAGLLLDQMDLSRVSANTEAWEKVVRKLRAGMMPHPVCRGPRRRPMSPSPSPLKTSSTAPPLPTPNSPPQDFTG